MISEITPLIAIFCSFFITLKIMPILMSKMIKADICGIDVNKMDKPQIPEMGGIGGVLGFTLGATFTLGLLKYYDTIDEVPVLVSISVICIASLIGLLDDVSILGRKEKAWFISLAALPLIISQIGSEKIDLIFFTLNLEPYHLFFWLVLVPFGVTGCANALNMSAGYNGLETGQFTIISFTLLIISIIENTPLSLVIIYASIFGSNLALYIFNKYPSKIFVGDIATLGFGALIAGCVIMSGHIIYGVMCIIPTFYELFATIKYYFKGIERRNLCMNPILKNNGNLSVPKGAEDYTLAYFILSKVELPEQKLVRVILLLYLLCGAMAISISLFT